MNPARRVCYSTDLDRCAAQSALASGGGCGCQVDCLENDWLINVAKHCSWHKPQADVDAKSGLLLGFSGILLGSVRWLESGLRGKRGMILTKLKLKAWKAAPKIPEYSPRVWRRDAAGNYMRFSDFGLDTHYGWFVDEDGCALHITMHPDYPGLQENEK